MKWLLAINLAISLACQARFISLKTSVQYTDVPWDSILYFDILTNPCQFLLKQIT